MIAGSHTFARSRIYDHRGISRLTLGKAIWGEREKGVHDPEHIAVNIVVLYDDRWLARELAKTTAEHPTSAWWIVDRIREFVQERAA